VKRTEERKSRYHPRRESRKRRERRG